MNPAPSEARGPGAGWALFDTPVGACGIAWSGEQVLGAQLPARDAGATRAWMARRYPRLEEAAPPPAVRRVIERIVAALQGAPDTLEDVALDERAVPPFHRRVYAEARRIPPGETVSYGELAQRLGEPGAARAIGQALGHNPFAPIVPCHRVLAAGGRPGGFSAPGGLSTKLRMLELEHARFGGQPGLF